MDRRTDGQKTVKTALLNTIANVISMVVGIVMIPVIARVIPASDLGVASTFLSTRNVFVVIATCAVYGYVSRAMLEFKDNKKDYLLSISTFCICGVLAAFCIMLPFKSFFMDLLTLDDFLFYWLFVSSLFFAFYNICNYYCIFHNKHLIVFFTVLTTGPLSQLISVGLAAILASKKYIGRVIGLDFVYGIVAIGLIIWLLIAKNKKPKVSYVKTTLKFSGPLVPHLLSQMVLTQCDLLMISYFCGSAKSGIYSMGHTVGFLALTVATQVTAAWSPWVYRRLEENNKPAVKENFKIIVLMGTYLSIGLVTVAPELIKIFLTDTYLPCIYIVPPLVMAMYFQFIYIFLYDLEYYYKKSGYIAAASIAAAVMNLVLNYIFIPMFGYTAAGYTTLVSYFVLLLLSFIFCTKLDVKNIYNIKFLVGTVIATIIYVAAMMVLADVIWLRYVLLVIITVILFITQYKKVIQVLKGLREAK
ncbi:MAG: oligosaccharide flippase family protein [Parasporobacterium sp.]|nr:oligosaccharide flippase family protein [Parasporobacterium sp.]